MGWPPESMGESAWFGAAGGVLRSLSTGESIGIGPASVEIAALGLPGAFAHLLVGPRQGSRAGGEAAQVLRQVDQLLGDHVDHDALALDAAAHLQELRRHDR